MFKSARVAQAARLEATTEPLAPILGSTLRPFLQPAKPAVPVAVQAAHTLALLAQVVQGAQLATAVVQQVIATGQVQGQAAFLAVLVVALAPLPTPLPVPVAQVASTEQVKLVVQQMPLAAREAVLLITAAMALQAVALMVAMVAQPKMLPLVAWGVPLALRLEALEQTVRAAVAATVTQLLHSATAVLAAQALGTFRLSVAP